MARKILGLIAGLVTFFVAATLIQLLSGLVFGMPSPEILGNPDKMKEYVATIPIGGFVGLLVSYIVASFAGGFVMSKLARWDSLVLPLILGLIGTLGWIYTFMQIPHPLWVTILGLLCFVPFAILGYRSGKGTV